MTAYTKTMAQAIGEMYPITEAGMSSAQIDQLKKAYEPMRGKKISVSNANRLSGIMDKFAKNKDVLIQIVKADIPFVSSAAVTRLISKHGMKGAEINKFKKEEMEFWAELDEASKPCKLPPHLAKFFDKGGNLKKDAADRIAKGKAKLNWKDVTPKGYGPNEETELDEGYVNIGGAKVKDDEKSILKHIQKTFPNVKKVKKDSQYGWIPVFEETELDEMRDMTAPPVSAKVVEDDGFRLVMKFKDGTIESLPMRIGKPSMQNLKGIVDKNILKNPKRKSWVPVVSAAMKKGAVKEEVELDEKTKWKMGDGRPRGGAYIENERFWDLDIDALKYIMKDADTAMKANPTGRKAGKYADEVNDAHTVIGWRKKNGIKEEVAEQLSKIKGNTPADQGRRGAVEDDIERAEKKGDKKLVAKLKEDEELDEGKMKELHGYIEAGKSAEWIAKKMGVDVKTIKALMSEAYELGTNEYLKLTQEVTPGELEEVDEASARADAKKAMRQDKKVDPADVDDDASDEDIKGASKNIIMQMRKAVSLRGNFKVEFGDKKKIKIPAKVAQAVQDKFNSIKKPADKEKFQVQVAKSYKDMLKVLKAGYHEDVKEETILDRIDIKLKERKNG